MADALRDDAYYDAIKRRFAEERELRLRHRPEGTAQYTSELTGALEKYARDPYGGEVAPRAPLRDEVEVLFIGGGFSALLTSARLREKGVDSIRIVERGADVGGTWYWNRYPGVACDVVAYDYLPLLDEMAYVPTRHYAGGQEILDHCRAIARRYDLYKLAVFQTTVTSTTWDEAAQRWRIGTDRGDLMSARFVVCANGTLSKPKLSKIAGMETFRGHSFHTSRWDYDYTGANLEKLADKTVGIIGTGATAVQCIPHLAESAKHLYVFQRTPSSVDVRDDRPTDPEWVKSLKPGWHKERLENFNTLVSGGYAEVDLVNDGWTEIIRNLLIKVRHEKASGLSRGELAAVTELLDYQKMEQIRARVDAIDTLPEEAERPIVSQAELPRQVLSIAIYGDASERVLKETAKRAREELSALPEISEVSLAAVRPYEIAIEVSEASLERHGLTFDQVAAAVRRASLDLPAGVVRADSGEILLRAQGKARLGAEFERIPVLVRADGTRLTLGDVAGVIDGFAESDQASRFDGKPAALVQVARVGEQRVIDVAAAAHAYVERAQATLPPGLQLIVWQDMSAILKDRLDNMKTSAWQGALLVVVALALFLRLRLAFWVAWGVPTALLATFAVLPFFGVSINWISLMGLVLVLGILVDDAIVVGENAYVEQQRSKSKLAGAIKGASDMAVPVVFGVLTTIAAFAPMLAVPGSMGKLVRALPVVVIASLTFSLLEALWILPAHLASGGPVDAPPRGELSRRWRAVQDRVAAGFDGFVRNGLAPALDRALEWRYFTISCATASVILTLALIASGWLRFTFQEPVEGDESISTSSS